MFLRHPVLVRYMEYDVRLKRLLNCFWNTNEIRINSKNDIFVKGFERIATGRHNVQKHKYISLQV